MRDRPNDIIVQSDGWAEFHGRRYRCAVGRSGLAADKKEGDGATPVGCFALRRLYYRPDRLDRPPTVLETVALQPDDGWSDDPDKPDYNTLVKLPHGGSHEKMWREDNLYDLVVAIGHNDDPPEPGKGSAVFIHVARPDYSATDACVAFSLDDLLEMLSECGRETRICVQI